MSSGVVDELVPVPSLDDGAGVRVELVPLAALTPAPWNPRLIRDYRFKNLCQSIQADPAFLWRRPVLAQADGTIYAGNMRYRAAAALNLGAIPAVVEDVPPQLAKERALRDNAQWGEWQEDDLSKLVYELGEQGSDLALLGFEPVRVEELLALVSGPDFAPAGLDEQGRLDQKQQVTCPECGHQFTP